MAHFKVFCMLFVVAVACGFASAYPGVSFEANTGDSVTANFEADSSNSNSEDTDTQSQTSGNVQFGAEMKAGEDTESDSNFGANFQVGGSASGSASSNGQAQETGKRFGFEISKNPGEILPSFSVSESGISITPSKYCPLRQLGIW